MYLQDVFKVVCGDVFHKYLIINRLRRRFELFLMNLIIFRAITTGLKCFFPIFLARLF